MSMLAIAFLASGCSVQRFAANKIGDTLASAGTTYSGDEDPELIGAALPFSLKLMESVLASTPEHRELLSATAAGFTQYAYAFVQQEADVVSLDDTDRAWAAWNRARRMYLRARNYGLRGLDVAVPGFSTTLRTNAAGAVAKAGAAEVDLLYWTAASWAAAIALGKDDPALVAELPLVSALIDRALAVDEDWDRGAIHSFLVTYEMARPDAFGSFDERIASARKHFDRTIALSQGRTAGPYVSWAESVCIPQEDRACFDAMLEAALKINPDDDPPTRLANAIFQRRAVWLLAHVDRWILPPLEETKGLEEQP
ncbi:MAG: TRAP transporter TatT component family protein [Gammaproteobacteria bacterium]|nr:TRAP transporter TatT component family protein [Gammaproteobacteria bacterium]